MRRQMTIKKGLDLKLRGSVADPTPIKAAATPAVAIVPDDFPGFLPKPEVKAGDAVKAGTPLFRDKNDGRIKLCSPISGTVREIVRGARRHIERIVIDSDGRDENAAHPHPTNADELRLLLMESGLWAMMRQRPFDIVPASDSHPRDIFVTLTDTAPLAVQPATVLKGRYDSMAAGVKALATLTHGKVYVAVPKGCDLDLEGAEMVEVAGPHPAGNAGVIASHIRPVNKGETIWTLDGATLACIGDLASGKPVDHSVAVAVTGPEITTPAVVTTVPGATMESLINGNLRPTSRPLRVISGNVLTGEDAGIAGYLRWPYRQVTVIADGSDVDEFLGWASPAPKMSLSRTFISWLMPRKVYSPDARINGGRRPMIMSGIYERMLPMDIMPEFLIKAMLSHNIEQMEALGVYEVAPEDFSAAEFADPSKLELQRIVRESLDYLRKEI